MVTPTYLLSISKGGGGEEEYQVKEVKCYNLFSSPGHNRYRVGRGPGEVMVGEEREVRNPQF